ncbi:MAG: hypothetical protein O3C67_06365 [Cyanobacteria bacterium]|nr:hypothetical protein [Cyanobacteriota bacterium]
MLSQPILRGVGLAATYGCCGVLVAEVVAGILLMQAALDHPQGQTPRI